MPNYKSENLTFLTVAEMTSMQVDSTDQDGLLFAVATDSTTFKMVMWRKTSSATIDNELVYPANGPGRWHVLPVGEVNTKEVLTVVGDTLPGSIDAEIDLIAQKKTNGDKVLKGRFDGVFEDFSTDNIAIYDDTLGSAVPPSGMRMAVVNKVSGDELYVAKNDQWELLDIAGGGDDTISFSQLPTGTTSNTVAIGNHSHTLDNLSDVVITAPSSGQIVSFNGTNWINQTPVAGDTNLNGLTDVVITTPTNGQTLSFNGTNWINTVASSGTSGNPIIHDQTDNGYNNSPLPATPVNNQYIIVKFKQYYGTGSNEMYPSFDFILKRNITYFWGGSSWKILSAENIIQKESAGPQSNSLIAFSPNVAVGAYTKVIYYYDLYTLDGNGDTMYDGDGNPISVRTTVEFQGDVPGQLLIITGSATFEVYMYVGSASYGNYDSVNGLNRFWKRIS